MSAISTRKRCSVCKGVKALDEFTTEKKAKSGRGSRCLECERKRSKDKFLALKIAALEHYKTGGKPACECCDEDIVAFLTIDHVNGGGSKHRADNSTARRIGLWLKRHGYPEGYRILCFNCNVGRMVNGGVCPHKTSQRC